MDVENKIPNSLEHLNNPKFFSFGAGGDQNNILNHQTEFRPENTSINNFNDYFKNNYNNGFNNFQATLEVVNSNNPYLPRKSNNQINDYNYTTNVFFMKKTEECKFDVNKNSRKNGKANYIKLNNHLISNKFCVSNSYIKYI